MMQGHDSPPQARKRQSAQRPNPASTGRRLKRNVRIGRRRTTIVLEAYVWESIDSMLDRENVSLDKFCSQVEDVRRNSSMASLARLVVLAYFRLLNEINSPPFVDLSVQRRDRDGVLRAPAAAGPPTPTLHLAFRRIEQDEAHAR